MPSWLAQVIVIVVVIGVLSGLWYFFAGGGLTLPGQGPK
jgi:hypothetical protein